MKAGCPVTTPALTVNRLCGSGFQAVVSAAQEIQLGESDIVLCGGSENMSQAPYALRDARFGTKLGLDLKVDLFLNIVYQLLVNENHVCLFKFIFSDSLFGNWF